MVPKALGFRYQSLNFETDSSFSIPLGIRIIHLNLPSSTHLTLLIALSGRFLMPKLFFFENVREWDRWCGHRRAHRGLVRPQARGALARMLRFRVGPIRGEVLPGEGRRGQSPFVPLSASVRVRPSVVPPQAGLTRSEPAPARKQENRKYFTLNSTVGIV